MRKLRIKIYCALVILFIVGSYIYSLLNPENVNFDLRTNILVIVFFVLSVGLMIISSEIKKLDGGFFSPSKLLLYLLFILFFAALVCEFVFVMIGII